MNSRLLEEDFEVESPADLRRQISIHSSLVQLLSAMGFNSELIEIAIAYNGSSNINQLINFLTKGHRG